MGWRRCGWSWGRRSDSSVAWWLRHYGWAGGCDPLAPLQCGWHLFHAEPWGEGGFPQPSWRSHAATPGCSEEDAPELGSSVAWWLRHYGWVGGCDPPVPLQCGWHLFPCGALGRGWISPTVMAEPCRYPGKLRGRCARASGHHGRRARRADGAGSPADGAPRGCRGRARG